MEALSSWLLDTWTVTLQSSVPQRETVKNWTGGSPVVPSRSKMLGGSSESTGEEGAMKMGGVGVEGGEFPLQQGIGGVRSGSTHF